MDSASATTAFGKNSRALLVATVFKLPCTMDVLVSSAGGPLEILANSETTNALEAAASCSALMDIGSDKAVLLEPYVMMQRSKRSDVSALQEMEPPMETTMDPTLLAQTLESHVTQPQRLPTSSAMEPTLTTDAMPHRPVGTILLVLRAHTVLQTPSQSMDVPLPVTTKSPSINATAKVTDATVQAPTPNVVPIQDGPNRPVLVDILATTTGLVPRVAPMIWDIIKTTPSLTEPPVLPAHPTQPLPPLLKPPLPQRQPPPMLEVELVEDLLPLLLQSS